LSSDEEIVSISLEEDLEDEVETVAGTEAALDAASSELTEWFRDLWMKGRWYKRLMKLGR
jgi:hypothetical protein